MKDVLQVVIENLVEDTNAVSIEEKQNDKAVVFEVKVAEADMGKVIGKQGRVAKAIRVLLKSIAAKEQKKVTIEFVE